MLDIIGGTMKDKSKLEALKKMAQKGRQGAETYQNDAFDKGQKEFAEGGMRSRNGDRYKKDDYSEEELEMAKRDRKERKSPFARPGETSGYEKKKTTLQKMRDYFKGKKS